VHLARRQDKGRRLYVLSGPWLTPAFQCNAFILENKSLDSAEILKLLVVLPGCSNDSKLTKTLENCQLKNAVGISFYVFSRHYASVLKFLFFFSAGKLTVY